MKIGQVVKSVAGRDKGKLLVLLSTDSKGSYVVDGKERPLKRPKLKNQKHLEITGYCLDENAFCSNKALRLKLKEIKQEMMNSERGHSNV